MRGAEATVASAAQSQNSQVEKAIQKGVKKFYFLCSYYDLMDVYDIMKKKIQK